MNPPASALAGSVGRAFRFLDAMVDAYAPSAAAPRLAQSYADQQGLDSSAFVYDNALAIIAYLARGGPADLARAAALGDGLLFAQAHDPDHRDGRLRQAYFAVRLARPAGAANIAGPPFNFVGSAVGDMAWAGLALARLFHASAEPAYLRGAAALGDWIEAQAHNTSGAGGYSYGVGADGARLPRKSTEHNIDAWALFKLLAVLAGEGVWERRARHARAFVEAMWNVEGGYYWTGSLDDGASRNPHPIPEDVQSWGFLAMGGPRFSAGLDWAATNLAATDPLDDGGPAIGGVSFSNASLDNSIGPQPNSWTPWPDPRAIWLEGTAHMAAALRARGGPGDETAALAYLDQLRAAQARFGHGQTVGGWPLSANSGLVAASRPLDTGFGFGFFPNLHLGATAWYCIAALGANPFQLPNPAT